MFGNVSEVFGKVSEPSDELSEVFGKVSEVFGKVSEAFGKDGGGERALVGRENLAEWGKRKCVLEIKICGC